MSKERPYHTALEGEAVRCLVVVPPGADAPAALMDGLQQRQVPVRQVADAATAMTELALDHYSVMVLVEPDRLVDGSRLAGSAARYHPSVRIWQYAQSGICELRDSAAEPPRPEPEIRVSPAPDRARVVTPAPVSQRTTGDGVHELKRPAMGVDDTGASSGVTLTAEELAMLLGDDPSPGGGKNA